jgi:prepilin-type N-terminal cleavage/methylation domain-containing protein
MAVTMKKYAKGMTLVEIMIAVVVVLVVVTGIMSYRYYSALDAKKAEVRATAGRFSLLLLEGWKGTGGADNYDPELIFASEFPISASAIGPAVPTDFGGELFNLLGSYEIVVEDVHYYTTLAYLDETATEPQTLNICTAWRHDYQDGTIVDTDKSVKLTTYTEYK